MQTYDFVDSGEELQHHGILGMKWGVRRYQNEDGSLTTAGKKQYGQKKKRLTPNQQTALYERRRVKMERAMNMKAAVYIGASFVNSYLRRYNYTLNGKPMRIPKEVPLLVDAIISGKCLYDIKRERDSYGA